MVSHLGYSPAFFEWNCINDSLWTFFNNSVNSTPVAFIDSITIELLAEVIGIMLFLLTNLNNLF